ncbi:tetratricopeptide repeat protein [Cecembia rubra]|uniref:Tetratricopeptide repeat protein n=1 Tax=Cecembia rubra TaxID=1485585 RepID=A0A2P8E8J9_9BACT|nr:tetratricopeptide repeat protein [Cecembia rubra]PSL05816.1 tetratricopeptide repeat protein [Cecembia rubra]
MRLIYVFFLILIVFSPGCDTPTSKIVGNKNGFILEPTGVFQGVGLLGDTLVTEVDSIAQNDQILKLKEAEEKYADDPSLDNLIWIGRREAYLGRYDLAIRTFSKAIKEFPSAFEPLRHRGHRFISIRKLDSAIADLEKAAELMEGQPIQIEQDGMPNKLNIPLSTVQFNVWYHLGLAHYLKGEWNDAIKAYKKCLDVSENDDSIVATLDWYYMALVKLGRHDEAKNLIRNVKRSMNIIENDAYHKRILMYKGELNPETLLSIDSNADDQKLQYVTQGYGLGNFYLSQGDTVRAKTIFENVLSTGYWSAFGYIASEMELANLKDE